MPYEYSDRLGQAIRKLYMYRRPRKGGDGMSNMIGSLGTTLGNAASKSRSGKEQDHTMKNAIAMQTAIDRQMRNAAAQQDASQEREDIEFIKGNREGTEGYPDMPKSIEPQHWGMPAFPNRPMPAHDPVKYQLQLNKQSEAAKLAPVNGVYTEQGAQNMSKTVGDNVHDIRLSKELMMQGMGGSRPIIGNF